jgi:hypothetical protein
MKLITGLLVAVVVLLGVVAWSVTRSDDLSSQEQLECAIAADAGGQVPPYPQCEDYIPYWRNPP